MSFKENLLKKIQIKRLSERVLKSLGSPDSGKKLDKQAMQTLLAMDGFYHQKTRDLDLFVEDAGNGKRRILVLGNELAFFHTTLEDVAMRRSPTVKEMISIRNAVKILNDKDIVISKGAATLQKIRQECLEGLDLTYSASDLEEIAQDGIDSLTNQYSDGVVEALELFEELLSYSSPPKEFQRNHYHLSGRVTPKSGADIRFGPFIVYSMMQNTLRLSDEAVSGTGRAAAEKLQRIIDGEEAVAFEGPDVFHALKRRTLEISD
ncbi:MAG: hypothetical protein P8Y38_07940 [Deltaproteobacteria bacterium]|jgi:hypothetical protein